MLSFNSSERPVRTVDKAAMEEFDGIRSEKDSTMH